MASKRRKTERPKDPTEAALDEAVTNRARMRATIKTLDPQSRDYEIAVRYVDGESLATIADDVGVAPETVRARLMACGIPLRPGTFRDPAFYVRKARALQMRAHALACVADCLAGCVIPPADLLARTTGGA